MHRDGISPEESAFEGAATGRHRDLPPGFVELTGRLAQTQEKGRDTEGTGCFSGFLVGACVYGLVLILSFPAGEALRQVSFDFGPTRTVEADVVRIDQGSPVVQFTTEDGELVRAWLPHGQQAEAPRIQEVNYRVHHPQDALAVDHPRSPAGPVLMALLAIWVLFELFHRRGLRAGWFWRRARTLVKGPLTRAEQKRSARPFRRAAIHPGPNRPVRGPWACAVVGAVLTTVGLAMVGAALVRDPEIWSVLASAPLTFGVCLLRAALYRHADTAPIANLSRPFRILPRGAVRWTAPVLVTVVIVVALPTLPTGNDAGSPSSGTEVPGRARIVDDGCHQVGQGRACEAYVVLEYRANGMDYRERVVVDLLGLDEFVTRRTVGIAWDPVDPRRVRLVDR